MIINLKHFKWDKRGVIQLVKKNVIFKMTDEVKNLTNYNQLPSHGTINEILIDDDLNCWFACSGYDRRQGGLYLKEWDKDHVKNIF